MDSWSFSKGFASDESLSNSEAFGKDEIGSTGWEVKPPYIFSNNMGFLQNENKIDNQLFGDMGFPPLMRSPLFNPENTFSSEENASNCQESTQFDLKLGTLIDQPEVEISNPSKNVEKLSQPEVCMPSKRARERVFGPTTPFCKVHGCNKDLSDCKEYHKRHKVCEVHSKTPKVIVNGIEQRFCQQCSRFHLLGEFDDGKRSCRKRLAGHNERRRKPHAGVFTERYGRLVPSYNLGVQGNEFKRSTGAIPSFLLPNNLHNPYQHNYETNARWQMNLEHRAPLDLQSISCITEEQLNSKSLSPCNFERNPEFNNIFNNYIRANSVSSGLSGIASSSENALSLLSSQSRSTSSQTSRIQKSNPQSHPMVFPNPIGSGPLDHYEMNPLLGLEGSLVKYGNEGILQGSKRINSEDEGCTIDLLQLSSQLERVENQKRSRVDVSNGVSVGLSIT